MLAFKHIERERSAQYISATASFSVRQVIDTVEQVIGQEVPKEDAPRRPGDPATLIASSDRIRGDWGWEPRHPELAEMVEHAWNWRKNHPGGYEG